VRPAAAYSNLSEEAALVAMHPDRRFALHSHLLPGGLADARLVSAGAEAPALRPHSRTLRVKGFTPYARRR
jgi:hypothetical protein